MIDKDCIFPGCPRTPMPHTPCLQHCCCDGKRDLVRCHDLRLANSSAGTFTGPVDYTALLPTAVLPNTGKKTFRAGQVWRVCFEARIGYVFKVVNSEDLDRIGIEILAASEKSIYSPGAVISVGSSSFWAEHAELVSDVVPTPYEAVSAANKTLDAKIKELREEVEALKKSRDDAKAGEGLALTAKEAVEADYADLETKYNALHADYEELEITNEDGRKLADRVITEKDKLNQQTRHQKTQIEDLEERLKTADRRAFRALKVADNASKGIGAMSSTLHRVEEMLDVVTRRLEKK